MVTMYVVRHCEAMGNVERIFQGNSDFDISPLGAKQLEKLKERFDGVKLDAVYSSPKIRAYKTAQSIVGDKNIEIIKDDGLRELNGGIIEGLKFTEIYERWPEIEETWTYAPQNFATEGGESMRSVYERIWKTVLKIAKENVGKTVAIATHGAASRCLLCRIQKGTVEELINVSWTDNTSVTKIVFDDDFGCTVEYENDTSHLTPELLPRAHKISSIILDQKGLL
ncbi:MAG: histidine phosphatase family protein [Clostridiales bacterium]|nr:histidine phosphatase family protein [Candidatus Equinaster intestinalis]